MYNFSNWKSGFGLCQCHLMATDIISSLILYHLCNMFIENAFPPLTAGYMKNCVNDCRMLTNLF